MTESNTNSVSESLNLKQIDDQRMRQNSQLIDDLPPILKEKLVDMTNKLDEIEPLIEQVGLLQQSNLKNQLEPIDMAKFDWVSIYAINSLYFVYLKNIGVQLKEHPIMTELSRIKNYLTRINEIVEANKLKQEQHVRIDKESSSRIIKRSLWMNASNQTNSKNANEHQADDRKNANDSNEPQKNKRIKFDN